MTEVIITSKDDLEKIIRSTIEKTIGEYLTAQKAPAEIGGLELAEEVTGLKRPSIYALCSKKKIPFIKLGKLLRFERKSLLTWMREKKQVISNE